MIMCLESTQVHTHPLPKAYQADLVGRNWTYLSTEEELTEAERALEA